jgi:DNA primase large subunit
VAYCDFFSKVDTIGLTTIQKLSNADRLVKHLFSENESTDKKYRQLLSLHNEAMAAKGKEYNGYNTAATQKIIDENNNLKREMVLLRNEK